MYQYMTLVSMVPSFQLQRDGLRFQGTPVWPLNRLESLHEASKCNSSLRTLGVSVFAYLDDWLVIGESKRQAERNVSPTLDTLARPPWLDSESQVVHPGPPPADPFVRCHSGSGAGTSSFLPGENKVSTEVVMSILHNPQKALIWLMVLSLMASLVDVVDSAAYACDQIHLLNVDKLELENTVLMICYRRRSSIRCNTGLRSTSGPRGFLPSRSLLNFDDHRRL